MTERELKRRISDALLKGGLAKDAGLEAAIAGDAEAQKYVGDLQKLDGLLGKWPLPDRGDDGWEALATRIEQRLLDRATAPGDMTLAPRFEDDDPFVREPSKFSPARAGASPLARAAPAAAPKPASPPVAASPRDAAAFPPSDDATREPEGRTTSEIAVSDLELASTPPPLATPAGEKADDFSLANLTALEVKHVAPPPVPKDAALHTPHHRAPEPKQERASIPPVRQPIAPLAPLPVFSAPLVVAKAKSRAPLYGMLAMAATVVVAVGSWMTLGRGAPDAAAPAASTVAQNVEATREENAMSPPAAMPVAPSGTVAPDDGERGGEAYGEQQRFAAGVGAAPATPLAAPPPAVVATATDGVTATLALEHGAQGAATPPAAPRPHHAPAGGGGAPPATGSDAPPPTGGAEPHAGPAHVTTGHDATGTTEAPTHHAHGGGAVAPAPSGDTPARDDVVRALGAVHSAVQTCAAGRGGVAWVQVTFAGPTGRVSNALVQGNFAGTPQGSCIARAVRSAQVAPFHSATFSVAFPFQL